MKNLTKNFIFVLLIIIAISGVFSLLSNSSNGTKIIPISQVVQEINQGKVKSITLNGDNLTINYNDNATATKSVKETGTDLIMLFNDYICVPINQTQS